MPHHRAGHMECEMVPQPSLRPRQSAQFLGIGESTFWRWVKERPGFPQPIKLAPRVTVFQLEQLAAWRDAQATKGAA